MSFFNSQFIFFLQLIYLIHNIYDIMLSLLLKFILCKDNTLYLHSLFLGILDHQTSSSNEYYSIKHGLGDPYTIAEDNEIAFF
jgi:hypothetical protein